MAVRLIQRPGARRALAWLACGAMIVAIALAGILLGLRLAGQTTSQTALGRISLRVEPAWHGEIEVFIPVVDWGVRAAAFSGPVRLHLEPRSADRGALLEAAAGDHHVLTAAEHDARGAVRHALVRALGWAIGGALALGLIAAAVARARRRRAAVAVGCALAPTALAAAVSVGVLLWLQSSFDPRAFQNPSFYARGAELAQVLRVADDAQAASRGYTSSVYQALAGYSTLLTAAGRLAAAPGPQNAAFVVSDLHDNRLVLPALGQLVSGGPIFFVGDFGQSGTRAEARALVPRITALGRPIIAVSGNHDSRLFMRALARAGVIVLTDRGRLRADGRTDGTPVQRIAGLRVAGYPDPLEWKGSDPADPRRIYSFAQLPDGTRRHARDQAALISWFAALRPRPQVVLVHESGFAVGLARAVAAHHPAQRLLILTGHDHHQHVNRYGHVLVVDGGTVGAGGIFGVGHEQVGMAELDLPRGKATPNSIDLIKVDPLTTAADAQRLVPSSRAFCDQPRVYCNPSG